MPARFVYWMNVSLDLFIEAAPDENGGGNWMRIDEPLHREFNRRAREFSLDVSGRKVYEIMETYWPATRSDESEPEVMREYGEIWVSTPKILVSHTRTSADYDTRIIGGGSDEGGDAIEQLATIRAESEGFIGVGGANLATQLLHAHLLDEIMLFTHPVVLGSGRPLFDSLSEPLELELLEQQRYDHGVTLHRYAVSGAL